MLRRRNPVTLVCLLATVFLLFSFSPPASVAAPYSGTPPSTYGLRGTVAHFAGTVAAIGETSITIQGASTSRTLPLGPHVIALLVDGSLGRAEQIPIGAYVMIYARGDAGAMPIVTAIAVLGRDALPQTTASQTSPTPSSGTVTGINGTITAIGQDGLHFTAAGGTQAIYPFSGHVSIMVNGHAGGLSALPLPQQARIYVRSVAGASAVLIGVMVGGEGRVSASPTTTANTITQPPPTVGPSGTVTGINGMITAIGQDGLHFTAADGTQAVYPFSGQVSIMVNGHAGGLSELPLPQQARIYVRSVAGASAVLIGVMVGGEGRVSASPTP